MELLYELLWQDEISPQTKSCVLALWRALWKSMDDLYLGAQKLSLLAQSFALEEWLLPQWPIMKKTSKAFHTIPRISV